VGGVRGLLESVVPVTAFSLVYGVSHDLTRGVVAALVPAAAMALWRLIGRETLVHSLSGLVVVAVGAYLATRTGRAENFFLPTIVKNAGYGLAYAVSALVRWPVVGILFGIVMGGWTAPGGASDRKAPSLADLTAWRRDPVRMRAYTQVTWIWVGVFGIRLLVQVPLYLASAAVALGYAAVPLGLPLFGAAVWLSWLVLRRMPPGGSPAPAAAPLAGEDDVAGPPARTESGSAAGRVSGAGPG
jgi:hypothetical protein